MLSLCPSFFHEFLGPKAQVCRLAFHPLDRMPWASLHTYHFEAVVDGLNGISSLPPKTAATSQHLHQVQGTYAEWWRLAIHFWCRSNPRAVMCNLLCCLVVPALPASLSASIPPRSLGD